MGQAEEAGFPQVGQGRPQPGIGSLRPLQPPAEKPVEDPHQHQCGGHKDGHEALLHRRGGGQEPAEDAETTLSRDALFYEPVPDRDEVGKGQGPGDQIGQDQGGDEAPAGPNVFYAWEEAVAQVGEGQGQGQGDGQHQQGVEDEEGQHQEEPQAKPDDLQAAEEVIRGGDGRPLGEAELGQVGGPVEPSPDVGQAGQGQDRQGRPA